MSHKSDVSGLNPNSQLIVSGGGYSIVSMDGRPRPNLNVFTEVVDIGVDDIQSLEQWLLNNVLRIPKNRKFMGLQDKLAVVAAARALLSSGLLVKADGPGFQSNTSALAQRCGVYLTVGYIPFEYNEIAELSANSQLNNEFSMLQFSTQGIENVNPLLTFRCLPNMPAFHVSVNFSLRGPYSVSYPDLGQFYQMLHQASVALRTGQIDYALVGGVADQNNFLVQNQLKKLEIQGQSLDCAAFLVLQRKTDLRHQDVRPYLELVAMNNSYQAIDPLKQMPSYYESLSLNDKSFSFGEELYFGPASLALILSAILQQSACGGEIHHRVNTSASVSASSHWQVIQNVQP